MDYIINSILTYINNKKTIGCYQIKGCWGCGKTYFVKNILFDKLLNNENPITPVLISLFGLNDIKDIHHMLLNSYINIMNKTNIDVTDDMNRGLDYLDFKYGSNNNILNYNLHDEEELIYSIIPKEKVILIIDDVERFLNEDNVEQLLGIINTLTEVRGYKVIIIYNEDFQRSKKLSKLKANFKEKVIGYAVKYSPSSNQILKTIINEFNNETFVSFMNEDKVYNLFNTDNYPYEYRTYFKNFRIIKFIVSTFYNVFEHYKDYIEDSKTKSKLLYYLTFIIGVSIEYKLDRINDINCHNLDVYTNNINLEDFGYNEIDYSLKKQTHQEINEKELNTKQDNLYAKQFYNIFIRKFNLEIIFLSQLYYNITAGSEIDFDKLDYFLSTNVSEFKQETKPGNVILNKINKGVWLYENDDFNVDLNNLLEYTEKSELDGCFNYIKAAHYLEIFKEIINVDIDELKRRIKKGIDGYININGLSDEEIIKIEHLDRNNWFIEYLKERINEFYNCNYKETINELKHLFVNNIEEFTKKFKDRKYQKSELYTTSILQHICDEEISKKMKELTPSEIRLLYNFIITRYTTEVANNLKPEVAFLNYIKKSLNEIDNNNKTLSIYLTNNYLKPSINDAIRILIKKK